MRKVSITVLVGIALLATMQNTSIATAASAKCAKLQNNLRMSSALIDNLAIQVNPYAKVLNDNNRLSQVGNNGSAMDAAEGYLIAYKAFLSKAISFFDYAGGISNTECFSKSKNTYIGTQFFYYSEIWRNEWQYKTWKQVYESNYSFKTKTLAPPHFYSRIYKK